MTDPTHPSLPGPSDAQQMLDSVMADMAELRMNVAYLKFDVEATRRERDKALADIGDVQEQLIHARDRLRRAGQGMDEAREGITAFSEKVMMFLEEKGLLEEFERFGKE